MFMPAAASSDSHAEELLCEHEDNGLLTPVFLCVARRRLAAAIYTFHLLLHNSMLAFRDDRDEQHANS